MMRRSPTNALSKSAVMSPDNTTRYYSYSSNVLSLLYTLNPDNEL